MRMRIRRTGSVALAAIGLFLATSALAADDGFARKGLYIAAGGSYGIESIDASPLATLLTTTLSSDNSWGLNVRAGNRLESWLAFELQYEWMDGFDIDQSTGSVALPGPGTVAVYEPDIFTVNAKFFLPFWRAQPYLLVGGGIATYDLVVSGGINTLSRSSSGFAFRAGAGVDAYITRHLVCFAEATYVINSDSPTWPATGTSTAPTINDLYYASISAGLAYRF